MRAIFIGGSLLLHYGKGEEEETGTAEPGKSTSGDGSAAASPPPFAWLPSPSLRRAAGFSLSVYAIVQLVLVDKVGVFSEVGISSWRQCAVE